MFVDKLAVDAVIKILPSKLSGSVQIPSSKSGGHRDIICAALAKGESIVENISMSKDIEATIRFLQALNVKIVHAGSKVSDRTALKITGSGHLKLINDCIDCGESGSTLRFLIPLITLLDSKAVLTGQGKLVSRPLQTYYDIFDKQNIQYSTTNGNLPLAIKGNLRPGIFKLPGNISSQFVSGLLFTLPLLDGDSVIELTSPLESSSYVNMTLASLAKYGIKIISENHERYLIKGKQEYQANNNFVEGDWSQAAFWMVGGILGQKLTCHGLDVNSLQGDKIIYQLVQKMGANVMQQQNSILSANSSTHGIVIDAADCPDIVPILTVLASISSGTTKIINAGRLRIKECDRLAAITSELNKMGANIIEQQEGLIINGCPQGLLGGCDVSAWNDHRIAMSLAIAAQCCQAPIVLHGAGSVSKSYPNFWQDYCSLGGRIEVLS